MLMLGMPLAEVVRASTCTPANALGVGEVAGSLAVGREADIAVLELVPVDVQLEDSQTQLRRCRERLLCRAVWRAGQRCRVTSPSCPWPNEDVAAINRGTWDLCLVRDAEPPPPPRPEVAARVAEKVAQRAAYVESMSRNTNMLKNSRAQSNGDSAPNVLLYMALATFAEGGLPAWVTQLPWCGDEPRLPNGQVAMPMTAVAVEDEGAEEGCRGGGERAQLQLAQRPLISFPLSAAEQELQEQLLRCC